MQLAAERHIDVAFSLMWLSVFAQRTCYLVNWGPVSNVSHYTVYSARGPKPWKKKRKTFEERTEMSYTVITQTPSGMFPAERVVVVGGGPKHATTGGILATTIAGKKVVYTQTYRDTLCTSDKDTKLWFKGTFSWKNKCWHFTHSTSSVNHPPAPHVIRHRTSLS